MVPSVTMAAPALQHAFSFSSFIKGERLCPAVRQTGPGIMLHSVVQSRASVSGDMDVNAGRVAKTAVAAATLALVVTTATPSGLNVQAAYAGDTTAVSDST